MFSNTAVFISFNFINCIHSYIHLFIVQCVCVCFPCFSDVVSCAPEFLTYFFDSKHADFIIPIHVLNYSVAYGVLLPPPGEPRETRSSVCTA